LAHPRGELCRDRSGFPQGLAKARETAARRPILQTAKHQA